ncbi:hypothetical protein B296_00020371 [Ensete ventricosum]|uniref:Uncharacterized protein n=1 Tax=Ensete ventricosum TaxID=4639 RepID=A0A426Z773_ENSVE|nr:hypothetical protein B296_00020371 [Ensete ventricosum]
MCASKLALDESLGHQHMRVVYHRGRSQIARTSESHGGDLIIQRKASVRKEVDSKEHHNAVEADLPIAKEGMKMQGNR